MKNVVFLSSDNINALTGAAKFVRLLISGDEIWEKNGLNLKCFSNSGIFQDETKYRKTFKFKIKQIVKSMLGKTRIGKRVRFFEYQINMLGKKPLNDSKAYIKTSMCVILNDLRVAYNYYQKYNNTKKSIFIMHNSGELLSMMYDEMKDNKIKVFLCECKKTIFENATYIVFVSEVARQRFIHEYPEYSEKSITIYIGMNEQTKRKRNFSGKLRLVTVGSVCNRKNQILAIKAVEEIKNDDLELIIVGGGYALEEYKQYVLEHGLSDKVKFTGATNNVNEILQYCDVFIMTSKDEGLPVAAQEAMSVGLPLILTDVGGCSELINGNGLLINSDLDEVKQAILYILKNRSKIEEYGNNSLQIFKSKFSIEVMQNSYINLVTSTMK